MKLLTAELKKTLTKAGYDNETPICKLFTPWGKATWLITGLEDGILYGYADLGMGCVEWGGIASLEEMESIRGPFGLKIERDLYWSAKEGVNYSERLRMLESLVGA
jgi:hypothetical protein